MNGWLAVTLRSGTTFASGEEVAAEVDIDVEHEPSGLPKIGAKTLKGLLLEGCREVSDAFGPRYRVAQYRVFGKSKDGGDALMTLDDALLPDPVRRAASEATLEKRRLHPLQLLAAFSEIRQQTRIDPESGAPATQTLRSTRVVVPGLTFFAPVGWLGKPDENEKALFAGSVLAVKRGGLLRNRGRGRIVCRYLDSDGRDLTVEWADPLNVEWADPLNAPEA